MPVASEPAAMGIVAVPLTSGGAGEVYAPLVSITDPVGVALAPPPLTVTVTDSGCNVVMLADDGAAVTVGVTSAGAVTATIAVPEAAGNVVVSPLAGVKAAVRVSVPGASDPAGMTVVNVPAAQDVYKRQNQLFVLPGEAAYKDGDGVPLSQREQRLFRSAVVLHFQFREQSRHLLNLDNGHLILLRTCERPRVLRRRG